jgi:hypothetical protein
MREIAAYRIAEMGAHAPKFNLPNETKTNKGGSKIVATTISGPEEDPKK